MCSHVRISFVLPSLKHQLGDYEGEESLWVATRESQHLEKISIWTLDNVTDLAERAFPDDLEDFVAIAEMVVDYLK